MALTHLSQIPAEISEECGSIRMSQSSTGLWPLTPVAAEVGTQLAGH